MKSKGVFLAAILTAVLCISGNLLAYSGDGDGSTESPYQISTIEDWQELMATSDDWSSSFILTADVNLAEVALMPVGNGTILFDGVFNGQGHVIRNVTINLPDADYVGLFGCLTQYAQIRNLGVENVKIIGRNHVGALAGNSGFGKLTACYATGSVSGTDYYAGGLVGKGWSGALTDCYATCSVSGTNGVGGLVGDTWGSLTACYATGSVTGTDCVGGLAGEDRSLLITGCYATGSVTGNEDVGGLVGFHCYGSLTASYATGSVSGTTRVGGLVGFQNASSITNCYSAGAVSGIGQSFSYLGGLLGKDWGSPLTGCFWDIQTSGLTYSAGGTGKSTADMQTLATFTSAGWDFVGETTNGTNDYWRMCADGVDYPRLNWQSIHGDLVCPDGVNFIDYACFATRWSTAGCSSSNNFCGGADMNFSGTVDMADLEISAANWLAGI